MPRLLQSLLIAGTIAVLGMPRNAFAADADSAAPSPPDSISVIETRDGSTVVGWIIDETGGVVTVATSYGELRIPRDRIAAVRIRRSRPGGGDGKYRFEDPNDTRLFFAPTGRMLPKGGGYLADYYLFFPSANYGITSRVSIGGGFSIFPTGNMADQVYFLTPKVGLKQSERLNIAAGALVMKLPDFDEDVPMISVLYGVATWGGSERNVTAGIGYGMVDTKLAKTPLIVLGGEYRLTDRLAFVSENWKIPNGPDALVSVGLRLLSENFTTDFALINDTHDPLFPGIPYIDFVYHFHR